jgi:hypothetical protein
MLRLLITRRSAVAGMTRRMNDVALKKRVCHGCNIVKEDESKVGLFQQDGDSFLGENQ